MAGNRSLRLEVILAAIDRATAPIKAISGSSKGLAAATRQARDRLRELEQQNKKLEAFRQTARDVAVTGNAMQTAQARVRDLAREIAATNAPTKTMLRNFEAAKREAAQLKDRNQSLTDQQQRLRRELEAAGMPTRELASHQRTLRQQIDDATGALKRQEAALKAQGERMQRLATARAQYQRTLEVRNRLAGTGAAMTAGGGAVLYGGARMLGEGVEFSRQMSRVQTLTGLDRNSQALAQLREQARHLGAATMFSATEAASGQAFLAMAGFTPEAIQAALPGLLNTALAGDMELARTADIASNILSAFKLDPTQMGMVSDVLTKAFTTSNMSLEQLGETMKYVGPVAAAASMSLEEAAAMTGLLGNVGLQGSNAGTTLRAMLLRLAGATGPAKDALAELGVEAVDAEGNVRNMPQILKEVAAAMESLGMGSGQRLEMLKTIFGERPAAGLAELIDQGGSEGLDAYLAVVADHAGAAAQTAHRMADNVTGDLDELASAWSDVKIELFDANEGALRSLLKTLTQVVARTAEWMKENPRLVATLASVAAVVAALVAGVGTLLLGIAAVLGPLAMVKLAVTALGITLGAVSLPILAVIAGVAALAAIAALVWAKWEPIKAFFAELWAGVRATTSEALEWFASLPARFLSLGADMMRGMADGIKKSLGGVKNAITGAGDAAVGWFKDKLGIRSPSRVFAMLGDDTMAGLAEGLERSERNPLAALSRAARNLTAAAGIGLAGMAAADGGFAIDNRPPLSGAVGAGAGGAGAPIYNITINAAPGMNEQTLARLVAAELDRRDRELAARRRSRLSDDE